MLGHGRQMKHRKPDRLLTRTMLVFVRDHNPTVDDFTTRCCRGDSQVFHVLRKHRVVVIEKDRVRLNRRHLSPDGLTFVWGIRRIHLDSDQVDYVRWAPGGPRVFSDEP